MILVLLVREGLVILVLLVLEGLVIVLVPRAVLVVGRAVALLLSVARGVLRVVAAVSSEHVAMVAVAARAKCTMQLKYVVKGMVEQSLLLAGVCRWQSLEASHAHAGEDNQRSSVISF